MAQYFTNKVKLYSTVLFNYAAEKGIVAEIKQDFDQLETILAQDPSVIKNISAPIYSESEQKQMLSAAISYLKLSAEVENFIYKIFVFTPRE